MRVKTLSAAAQRLPSAGLEAVFQSGDAMAAQRILRQALPG